MFRNKERTNQPYSNRDQKKRENREEGEKDRSPAEEKTVYFIILEGNRLAEKYLQY